MTSDVLYDTVIDEKDRLRMLLARYISHVRDCEGVDFITTGSHPCDDNFTKAEWGELKKYAMYKREVLLTKEGERIAVWRPSCGNEVQG